MEDNGAHRVYVTDSGGAMTMDQYATRLAAYDRVLKPETQRGVHAHHNLSLGVANSIVAVQGGAVRVDASLRNGRGRGQRPTRGVRRIGLPGATQRHSTRRSCDQRKMADEVSSVPLSLTTVVRQIRRRSWKQHFESGQMVGHDWLESCSHRDIGWAESRLGTDR